MLDALRSTSDDIEQLVENLKKIKSEIYLFLIILLAISLRLLFFNGLRGHDDWVYLFYTKSLYYGITKEAFSSLWGMRLTVILPALFLFKIFQPSYTLAFLPTFLFSLGSVILAYLISLNIFKNKKVALLSAFFMSFYTLEVFVGTTIRSDVEVAFFSGLSIYFFIKSDLKNRKLNKKTILYLILSGISAYLAYMSKETGILILYFYFIFFCYDLFSRKKIQSRYLFILVGLLILFSLECIFYRTQTGNWLQRYEKGSMWYTKTYETGGYENDPTTSYMFVPCFLFNIKNGYCLKLTGADNFTNSYFAKDSYHLSGFFFYTAFFFMLLLLLKKDKNSYIFIIWLISILLFILFGSMSLKYYIPFHKEPRYFTIISLPSMIMLTRGFDFALNKRNKIIYYSALLFIVFLFLSSILILYKAHDEYIKRNRHTDEIYEFFKDKPDANIFADTMIGQELDLKFNYKRYDYAHNFPGKAGYGFLIDLNFFQCKKGLEGTYIVESGEVKIDFYKNLKECIDGGRIKLNLIREFKDDIGEARIYYLTEQNIIS